MRRCLPLAVLVYSREPLRCPDIHLDLWTCLVYFCFIYPVGLLQVCRFSMPPLCSPRMSGNPWWPLCHAGTIRNEGELRLFTHLLATLRHVEKSFSCVPTTHGWLRPSVQQLFLLYSFHAMLRHRLSLGTCPGSADKADTGLLYSGIPQTYMQSLKWDSNPHLTWKHKYFFLNNITSLHLNGHLRKTSVFWLQFGWGDFQVEKLRYSCRRASRALLMGCRNRNLRTEGCQCAPRTLHSHPSLLQGSLFPIGNPREEINLEKSKKKKTHRSLHKNEYLKIPGNGQTLKSYTKWKETKHKKPHIVWFHLYKMSRIGKSRK